MSEPPQLLVVDGIADRARALWRDACDRATTAHVELFAKVAVRSRVTRDLSRVSARFDRAFESDSRCAHSARTTITPGSAAASGFSAEVVRWAVDTACAFHAQASASAPDASDSVAEERWDLDATAELPGEVALTNGLLTRPQIEWIEAGTTVEVLIGIEGWLAARRRHRVWALSAGPEARLIAQRGFEGWERLLDSSDNDSSKFLGSSDDLDVLLLTLDAAAPVVAGVGGRVSRAGCGPCGGGRNRAGVSPTSQFGTMGSPEVRSTTRGFPRPLAHWPTTEFGWGRLDGPGTFRRTSFREPPTESATNLCVPRGRMKSSAAASLSSNDAAFFDRPSIYG